MLARSFMQRGAKKGFLANDMIDERCERCPSYMNMIKNLLRKLSPETSEIVEKFNTITKSCYQFQSAGRITEELFNELDMPKDADISGAEISKLTRSEFTPRQTFQLMSTELHLEIMRMQKEKVLQQKRTNI